MKELTAAIVAHVSQQHSLPWTLEDANYVLSAASKQGRKLLHEEETTHLAEQRFREAQQYVEERSRTRTSRLAAKEEKKDILAVHGHPHTDAQHPTRFCTVGPSIGRGAHWRVARTRGLQRPRRRVDGCGS